MISLTWILAIVGTLGVGGTIAAYLLFPVVVAPIVEGALRALVACKLCLVAMLVVGVGIGSWWFGHHRAEVDCRAEEIAAAAQSKIDAANKDAAAARSAAADASLKLAKIQEQTKADEERTADYVKELENRPAPSCALTDDDLRGMHANPGPHAARKRPSAAARWINGARRRAGVKAR